MPVPVNEPAPETAPKKTVNQGKAAMQELRKLMESAPKPRDVVEKLKDVLTAEQMEKLKGRLEEARGRAGKRGK